MRIFLHELKMRRKSLFVWSVVMVLFIALSMLKYDSFVSSGQDVGKFIENFPSTLKAVFGLDGLNLGTLSGYFGTIFTYTAVLSAIFGGTLGANLLADEEADKTVEFLYTKPVSRHAILTQKILAATVIIFVFWAVTTAGTFGFTTQFSPSTNDHTFLLLVSVALLLILLLSAALGLLLAAFFGKRAGRYVALFVLGSYLATTIAHMSEPLGWLKYLTIFSWYDAARLLRDLSLDPIVVTATLLISVIAMTLSYLVYQRRDLTV